MILYLIRHATNDFVGQRLAGRLPGVNLNQTGQAQTRVLSEFFRSHKIHAIHASPLERTMQTATPIAKQLNLKVQPDPALLEMDYGTWQGKTLKSLRRRKIWPIIQQHPARASFPEGESFASAQLRIIQAIEKMYSMFPDKNCILVSHGDMIKLAISYFLGLSLDHFQKLTIVPASISTLQLSPHTSTLLNINLTLPQNTKTE